MPDATTPPPTQAAAKAALVIPPDVQQKFGPLLALIQASESMNNDERQYWINILPIMTEEQIKNLSEILENERKQLAAIDAKYQTEIQKIGAAEVSRETEEERKKRREQRQSQEQSHKKEENAAEEDLLKKIDAA